MVSYVAGIDDSAREIRQTLRRYWDEDARTYDRSPEHVAHTRSQHAAWAAALLRHLPPPPVRVMDVGAGTGFLSLILAELGYDVTAVDFSPAMLEVLGAKARRAGLDIEIVEGLAETPPPGPFDAIVERLLLWTLIDPAEALSTWRTVAPGGRLLSFGGLWGGDRIEAARARGRALVRRLRREPPHHHAPYPVPFAASDGIPRPHPDYVIGVMESAGWQRVRLERLYEVEWAQTLASPLSSRLLGVTPEFLLVADARSTSP